MKITGEITYRNDITDIELGKIIETAVSFIIHEDEDGNTVYRPYYKHRGIELGIAVYGINGVKFDINNDSIYEEIHRNEEIINAISTFYKYEDMDNILECIDSIVEFRKQESLHKNDILKDKIMKSVEKENVLHDLEIKLAKKQNTVLTQQIKANEFNNKVMEYMKPEDVAKLSEKVVSGEYDMRKVAEIITDKYINSELHKEKVKSVMEVKKNKVVNFSSAEDDGK